MKNLALLFSFFYFSTQAQIADSSRFIQLDSLPAISSMEEWIGNGEDHFHYFSIPDSTIECYRLPKDFAKPKKWKGMEESRLKGEFYGNSYSDAFNIQSVLLIIDTAKDFGTLCSAKSWCLKNYEVVFPYLISRLSWKIKVGLENSADLIIWERIGSGDLKFYGHGGGMQEDVFTIAGRASWILNEITGESFAIVSATMSEEESHLYKKEWKNYIDQLKE